MDTTSTPLRVESAETSPTTITVGLSDGTTVRCNRFWLRDNCPSNGDRTSLFRPFTVASMDDDLTITAAEMADGELLV